MYLKKLVGTLLNFIGWGISLHAVASELYQKGGYLEILSIQGEYIGLALNLLGTILLILPGKMNTRTFRKVITALKENVSKVIMYIAKDLVYLVSLWQLDLVAAGTIAKFYPIVKDWTLYLPVGIDNKFPYIVIAWDATSWSFPDAYVRFILLMTLAFFLPEIYLIVSYLKKKLSMK